MAIYWNNLDEPMSYSGNLCIVEVGLATRMTQKKNEYFVWKQILCESVYSWEYILK